MRPYRLFLLVLALATGCGPAIPAPMPTPERAAFAGFDTWRYPGDDVMSTWRRESPFEWVGYYLPSPCHRGDSFAGKRQTLIDAGWGIAILYVGQQLFEDETPAEITETTLCTSHFLTEERGRIDGRDAADRAAAEGFPTGSIIFLDIERMSRVPPEMIAYYQGWLRAVLEDGRYRPGTYAHVTNATALYTVAQALLLEHGVATSIPFWVAGGSDFTLESSPEDSGYGFAHIWQGVLDTTRTWGGRTLTIDENVSRFPSPSSPDVR